MLVYDYVFVKDEITDFLDKVLEYITNFVFGHIKLFKKQGIRSKCSKWITKSQNGVALETICLALFSIFVNWKLNVCVFVVEFYFKIKLLQILGQKLFHSGFENVIVKLRGFSFTRWTVEKDLEFFRIWLSFRQIYRFERLAFRNAEHGCLYTSHNIRKKTVFFYLVVKIDAHRFKDWHQIFLKMCTCRLFWSNCATINFDRQLFIVLKDQNWSQTLQNQIYWADALAVHFDYAALLLADKLLGKPDLTFILLTLNRDLLRSFFISVQNIAIG